MGSVGTVEDSGLAGRVWNLRPDEVQPDHTGVPEEALDRRGLRWDGWRRCTAEPRDERSVHRGGGTREPTDVPDGPVRVPADGTEEHRGAFASEIPTVCRGGIVAGCSTETDTNKVSPSSKGEGTSPIPSTSEDVGFFGGIS